MTIEQLREFLTSLEILLPEELIIMPAIRLLLHPRADLRDTWREVRQTYFESQRRCLDALTESIGPVGRMYEAFFNQACIIIGGSIARLEYVPGESDFDFLPVKREPPVQQGVTQAELDLFEDMQKSLRMNVRRRIGSLERQLGFERAAGRIPVDMDGIPYSQKKYFFTPQSLFTFPGKDYEAAWAAFERARILFEHAFLHGDEHLFQQLQEDSDECYMLSRDIADDMFPLLSYCFLIFMQWSGIVGKTAHMRKENHSNPDALISKTLLGRVWSMKVSLLTVHILYWERSLGWSVPHGRILEVLQAPTIYKTIDLIPTMFDPIAEEVLNEIDLLPEGRRKRDLEETLYELYEYMQHPSDGESTCGGMFLDMIALCLGNRLNKRNLQENDLKRIDQWNGHLSRMLNKAKTLTEFLAARKTSPPSDPPYARFHAILRGDIFR